MGTNDFGDDFRRDAVAQIASDFTGQLREKQAMTNQKWLDVI